MKWLVAVLVVIGLAGCGTGPTESIPEPEPEQDRIDWPVRELRDTLIIWEPGVH